MNLVEDNYWESFQDSIRWDIKDFVRWVASDRMETKYSHLIEQSGGDPNR